MKLDDVSASGALVHSIDILCDDDHFRVLVFDGCQHLMACMRMA
jgi:hypothetical protein